MGTGWRRAFCTTIPRDRDTTIATDIKNQTHHQNSPIPSPRSFSKLGFLGGSTPSTPRMQQQQQSQSGTTTPTLRCRTRVEKSEKPDSNLQCKTTTNTPKSAAKTQKPHRGSNPSSPRSPFSILKNSLRLSRNTCGVCFQSLKTGQRMAIYTAKCSHTFHFPCIAAHVSKTAGLVCPVCSSAWKDVPLLAIHRLQNRSPTKEDELKSANVKSEQIKQNPSLVAVSEARSYDDDEPLLSPTAGGKFNAIPEVEDEEDEVEEFRGFFANPISSSSDESGGNNARNLEIALMRESAVVSVGQTHEAYAVVVRVKAPPLPSPPPRTTAAQFSDPTRRAPIDLVTVLDCSGTMSGDKLQMMKRAMRLVISSLSSADRLSIVTFSAFPRRLLPLRRMTPQRQRVARRIVDRLVCSQGSCVSDALKKATKVLEDRREKNPVASIMLLSDGHDEPIKSSCTNQRQPQAQTQHQNHVSSTRFSHVEIPVQSFGVKEKRREPAEDAFAKCVGGLLSVVAQDVSIKIGFASGSDPAEISAVYSYNMKPTVFSPKSVRLGDLYAEEEREFLVELRVPKPVVGSHHVLSVCCSYRDPSSQEMIYGREQALLVPRAQVVRSSSPKIERLRNLFVTTRAIAESKRLVEHNNNLSSAHNLLASTRALLIQSSSELAEEYIRGLEAELTELHLRRQYQLQQVEKQVTPRRREVVLTDENGEPLTPTSAWRAAEQLAKVAMVKKSFNRSVSDLHGFENARF